MRETMCAQKAFKPSRTGIFICVVLLVSRFKSIALRISISQHLKGVVLNFVLRENDYKMKWNLAIDKLNR